MSEHGGECLSLQLLREEQIGGLKTRQGIKVRPYVTNIQNKPYTYYSSFSLPKPFAHGEIYICLACITSIICSLIF
jgi:hypothetical protein